MRGGIVAGVRPLGLQGGEQEAEDERSGLVRSLRPGMSAKSGEGYLKLPNTSAGTAVPLPKSADEASSGFTEVELENMNSRLL